MFAPFGAPLLEIWTAAFFGGDVDAIGGPRFAPDRVDAACLPECDEHILGPCSSRARFDVRFSALTGSFVSHGISEARPFAGRAHPSGRPKNRTDPGKADFTRYVRYTF